MVANMTAAERKRQVVETNAIAAFDTIVGTRKFSGRAETIRYIKAQPRPLATAKRRAKALLKAGVLADVSAAHVLDHSDVQELRVKIIRKHKILDTPHASILAKMDKAIALGEMTPDRFNEMASAVLNIPCAVPSKHRAREEPV